jgi:hypothetical protein
MRRESEVAASPIGRPAREESADTAGNGRVDGSEWVDGPFRETNGRPDDVRNGVDAEMTEMA